MDTMPTTTTDVIPSEERIANLEREVEGLRRALETKTERVARFVETIENLPWSDINTGNFSPQEGCGDVATVRDLFIRLGCSESLLNEGLFREYEVQIRAYINLHYTVTATNEDDADEKAHEMLENDYIYSRDADHAELDSWNADTVHTERV
jgi:hypothetical protein